MTTEPHDENTNTADSAVTADTSTGTRGTTTSPTRKRSAATKRTAATPPPVSAASATAAPALAAATDIVQAIKDAAHAVVGFGLMGWNKAQVSRRDLMKDLGAQRHQVENQLDGAKEQIATAIRTLDAKIEPVRHDIESQLDKVAERLPGQVRDVVASARKVARDTEHQLRQAVGAL